MEQVDRFERIEARSMRHDVRRQLRRAILTRTLKAGERLNESQIAEEMGISRGPVREAILELVQEGLVEKQYGRGACVVELDPQSFYELADVRTALEGLAVRLAVKHLSPDGLAQLESNIEQMRVAAREEEIERVVDYDLELHRTICQLSGNRLLLKTWELLVGRLRLGMVLLYERDYSPLREVEKHSAVIRAMGIGDGELAAELLLRDCGEAASKIVSIIGESKTL